MCQVFPKWRYFISVGYDKKIVVYDFKESNSEIFADEKTNNSHKSAISYLHWVNNDQFVTCSLDKTVKLWDFKKREVLMTLHPQTELGVDEIQCAVVSSDKYIISLNLDGKINFWKMENLKDNGLPDIVLNGHQNYISHVIYGNINKQIFSSDIDGKILCWDFNKSCFRVHRAHECRVVKLALSCDNNIIYSYGFDLTLVAFSLTEKKELFKLKLKPGEPLNLQSSRKNPNMVYVLNNNCVFMVNNGQVEKEFPLSFEAKCFAVSETEYYLGDRDGNLHIFDCSFKLLKKMNLSQQELSCLKLSNNEKYLATGDNNKYIKILDTHTKDIYTDDYVHHKSKVYEISWSENDEKLVSGSLDRCVILWDLATKKKVKTYQDLDYEVVLTVCFGGNSTILCGGHSCSVIKINI